MLPVIFTLYLSHSPFGKFGGWHSNSLANSVPVVADSVHKGNVHTSAHGIGKHGFATGLNNIQWHGGIHNKGIHVHGMKNTNHVVKPVSTGSHTVGKGINNIGPAVISNSPINVNTASRGFAEILPFPQVIPMIPQLPKVPVPTRSQVNLQPQGRIETAAPVDAGTVVVNVPSSTAGNGVIQANTANVVAPMAPVVPVTPIQPVAQESVVVNTVPQTAVLNTVAANQVVPANVNARAAVPALPAFNSVEGRFSAGLDFDDPRIRTQSAAVRAARFDGVRNDVSGVGQTVFPGVELGNSFTNFQNLNFDQNVITRTAIPGPIDIGFGVNFVDNNFQLGPDAQFLVNQVQVDNGIPSVFPNTPLNSVSLLPDESTLSSRFFGNGQTVLPQFSPVTQNILPGASLSNGIDSSFINLPPQIEGIGGTLIPDARNAFSLAANNVFSADVGLNNVFPGGAIGAPSLLGNNIGLTGVGGDIVPL